MNTDNYECIETEPQYLEKGHQPKKPICNTCHSDQIKADSYAVWNPELDMWELDDTFDDYICDSCGGEAGITWVPTNEGAY